MAISRTPITATSADITPGYSFTLMHPEPKDPTYTIHCLAVVIDVDLDDSYLQYLIVSGDLPIGIYASTLEDFEDALASGEFIHVSDGIYYPE